MVYMVIFKVIDGDVYEIPVEARSYAGAQSRALAFIGVKRSEVVVCKA